MPEITPENTTGQTDATTPADAAPTRTAWPWTGWLAFGFPLLAAEAVYFLTAAAGLTWRHGGDDGGDLATAVALDGVPHPTGYPLFLLSGKLWGLLSPDPARALALGDGGWGALAAGCTSLAVYRLNRQLLQNSPVAPASPLWGTETSGLLGGWLAGLLLAFAPLVWSQAVIVEIYSLNLVLLAGLLLALVWWSERPQSRTRFYLLALVGGLGVGHHRTTLFSLVAAAVFVLLVVRARQETKPALAWPRVMGGLMTLGLAVGLPSLVLIGRGGQNPASNWDNLGWADPGGWWNYLTGGEYRNLLFAAPVGQDLGRVAATAGLLLEQFGLPGLLLGWAGLAVLWLGRPEFRPLAWLVTFGLAGHLFFAAVYAADNSQVYLLPFFAFWAVAYGFGLAWGCRTGLVRWPNLAVLIVGGTLLVAVMGPGSGLAANFSRLDLKGDRSAEAWARTQLDAAPPSAIVLTNQDSATFALWYVQYVQHYRPGVAVIETRLLGVNWYRQNLARLYPDLELPANGDSAALGQANPGRAVVRLVAPEQSGLP